MKKILLIYLKKIVFRLEKFDAYLSRKFKFLKEPWKNWKKNAPQYKQEILKELLFYLRHPFFFIHLQRDLFFASAFFKKMYDIQAAVIKLAKEKRTFRKEDYNSTRRNGIYEDVPTPERQAILDKKIKPSHWLTLNGWFLALAIIVFNAIFCFGAFILRKLTHTSCIFLDKTFKAAQEHLDFKDYRLNVAEYYKYIEFVKSFFEEDGWEYIYFEKKDVTASYFYNAEQLIDLYHALIIKRNIIFPLIDDFWFQLIVCCVLVLAKLFLFLLILYYTVLIFRFCVFGSTRNKAIHAYNNYKSYKYLHVLYTFLFFCFFVLILFLMPGVDDWFVACGFIPPFRWIYMDVLNYFQGSFFYTGSFWHNSRIWIPHTYGHHILHFFFFFPGEQSLNLYHGSFMDFLVSLQEKTYTKELETFMDTFLRLREIRHQEKTISNFAHKDFSIFYCILDFALYFVKTGFA